MLEALCKVLCSLKKTHGVSPAAQNGFRLWQLLPRIDCLSDPSESLMLFALTLSQQKIWPLIVLMSLLQLRWARLTPSQRFVLSVFALEARSSLTSPLSVLVGKVLI